MQNKIISKHTVANAKYITPPNAAIVATNKLTVEFVIPNHIYIFVLLRLVNAYVHNVDIIEKKPLIHKILIMIAAFAHFSVNKISINSDEINDRPNIIGILT